MPVASLMMLFTLVSLQVRHGFHLTDMSLDWDHKISVFEVGTYSVAWLALSMVVLAAARWLSDRAMLVTGGVIGVFGVFGAIVGSCLVFNPLWHGDDVGGWPVLNGLPLPIRVARGDTDPAYFSVTWHGDAAR